MIGAGFFGFMINLADALYYMQGRNSTPVRAASFAAGQFIHPADGGASGIWGQNMARRCLVVVSFGSACPKTLLDMLLHSDIFTGRGSRWLPQNCD